MLGYPIPRWLFALGLVLIAAISVAIPTVALAQKSVTVAEGDQTTVIRTQADTVADALSAAGLALFPEDIVQPPIDSPLDADSVITIIRASPVEIIEGGVTVLIRTHQQKITAILAEAGKTVAPGDSVWADGERVPPERWELTSLTPRTIRIQRAMPITIVDQNNTTAITTSALTVGEALAEADIALYVADGVTPPLSTPLTPNLAIAIQRSLPIAIEMDGRALHSRTHRGTVAEVLADAGVTLLGDDYAVPALNEPPPADGSPIHVVRVVEQIVTETKPLPYETQYQAVPELEIDNTQIVQAGAYGTLATRVRVRYENGFEVARAAEESWVAVAPQPRILGYGTKIVIHTLDTPNGPIEYWRAIRMYTTSYSASRAGTPVTAPWYGRTRSGKKLTIGMVAIDLRVMPLGTRLYVPGYGYATAEDTGGGVKGKWIDLGYDDWNFINWHEYVIVYFLTPVPPADQIKWVIP